MLQGMWVEEGGKPDWLQSAVEQSGSISQLSLNANTTAPYTMSTCRRLQLKSWSSKQWWPSSSGKQMPAEPQGQTKRRSDEASNALHNFMSTLIHTRSYTVQQNCQLLGVTSSVKQTTAVHV